MVCVPTSSGHITESIGRKKLQPEQIQSLKKTRQWHSIHYVGWRYCWVQIRNCLPLLTKVLAEFGSGTVRNGKNVLNRVRYGGYQSYDMMAYDAFRGECVLYGSVFGIVDGIASSSSVYTNLDGYRFIWRWNGQQWQADPPTPTQGAPYGQISGNLVFDSQRSGILLFGGIGGYGGLVTNYTYEILYQDDPAVLKQPTVQVSLQGQQVQLSVVAVGAPPIGYQWQKGTTDLKDGGHISGSTSNTLTINDAVPTDSGNYQLTLSNLCGLAVSQPILLNITTGPGTIAIGTEGGNSVNGSNIVITWGDNSAVLQSSTNVQGPWFNLPGATSPYMVQSNLPTQFFRLSYP